MSLTADDDRKHFYNVLNSHIAKKTTATGIDYHGLSRVINRTKSVISHAFGAERSDGEQREALAVNLNWLFNQLIYFAINDIDKM